MNCTKKIVAMMTAGLMTLNLASLGVCATAETHEIKQNSVTEECNFKIEFAVISWIEKDGEITITDIYPMYSSRVCDYPTPNVIAICIVNGVLDLPSQIMSKPVTKIKCTKYDKNTYVEVIKLNEYIEDVSFIGFENSYVMKTEREMDIHPMYVKYN